MFLRNNLVEFMNNLAKERRERNNFWVYHYILLYILKNIKNLLFCYFFFL